MSCARPPRGTGTPSRSNDRRDGVNLKGPNEILLVSCVLLSSIIFVLPQAMPLQPAVATGRDRLVRLDVGVIQGHRPSASVDRNVGRADAGSRHYGAAIEFRLQFRAAFSRGTGNSLSAPHFRFVSTHTAILISARYQHRIARKQRN